MNIENPFKETRSESIAELPSPEDIQKLEAQIVSKETFTALNRSLNTADAELGGIPTRSGEMPQPGHWQERINALRQSMPKDELHINITDTAKIRTKAVELMKSGQSVKEARDLNELLCGIQWIASLDGNKKEAYSNLLSQIFHSNRFNLITNLTDDYDIRRKTIELVFNRAENLKNFDALLSTLEQNNALMGISSGEKIKAGVGLIVGQIRQGQEPQWNVLPRIVRLTVKRLIASENIR